VNILDIKIVARNGLAAAHTRDLIGVISSVVFIVVGETRWRFA